MRGGRRVDPTDVILKGIGNAIMRLNSGKQSGMGEVKVEMLKEGEVGAKRTTRVYSVSTKKINGGCKIARSLI